MNVLENAIRMKEVYAHNGHKELEEKIVRLLETYKNSRDKETSLHVIKTFLQAAQLLR